MEEKDCSIIIMSKYQKDSVENTEDMDGVHIHPF